MKPKLERMDWEAVKKQATDQLRASAINQIVNEMILDKAEQQIAKCPNVKPKVGPVAATSSGN